MTDPAPLPPLPPIPVGALTSGEESLLEAWAEDYARAAVAAQPALEPPPENAVQLSWQPDMTREYFAQAMQRARAATAWRIYQWVDAQPATAQPEPVAWGVYVDDELMRAFGAMDSAREWAVLERMNGSRYAYHIRPLFAGAAPIAHAPRQTAPSAERMTWFDFERIRDLPEVEDAFQAFVADNTGDNATAVVRAVLAATPPASPPAPQQAPLTDAQIDSAVCRLGFAQLSPREVARAIEAAHGITAQTTKE